MLAQRFFNAPVAGDKGVFIERKQATARIALAYMNSLQVRISFKNVAVGVFFVMDDVGFGKHRVVADCGRVALSYRVFAKRKVDLVFFERFDYRCWRIGSHNKSAGCFTKENIRMTFDAFINYTAGVKQHQFS